MFDLEKLSFYRKEVGAVKKWGFEPAKKLDLRQNTCNLNQLNGDLTHRNWGSTGSTGSTNSKLKTCQDSWPEECAHTDRSWHFMVVSQLMFETTRHLRSYTPNRAITSNDVASPGYKTQISLQSIRDYHLKRAGVVVCFLGPSTGNSTILRSDRVDPHWSGARLIPQ